YTVIVGADDGIHPTVNQTFTFTINKATTSTEENQPEVREEEEEEQQPVEEEEEKTAKLSFRAPKQNDVFSDDFELIKWNFEGNDPITAIKLEYSSDLERWFEIGEIEANENYFLWDIRNLLGIDDDYFLKLTAETESGQTIE